jgi:iron complex outermembrane receptor protein
MKTFLAFIASTTALAATTAWAQDQQPAPAGRDGVQADGASEQDAPTAGIGEIVVTASRRAESVQRSALSIQALSEATLARANVVKPEDLGNVAAGLSIAAGGASPQIYIRGVGTFGGNAYDEAAVAVSLDGIYISRPWATRGMFFDLQRVEVLKGPQGTLYGRNASGGALNVITAKPQLDKLGGFVEGQLGNYDLRGLTGAINVPLSDTLAVRAAGQFSRRDGYLTDGYNDDQTEAGRLQLFWKPNADFSLLIGGHYQHTGGKGAGAVLRPQLPGNKWRGASDPAVTAIYRAEPFIGPLLAVPRADGFLDATVYAVNAEMNWNLGFATLTMLPSYRDSKLRDLHYFPGFGVADNEHDRQTSVEMRLADDGDRLKWVAGAFYFDEHQSNLPGLPLQDVIQGIANQKTENIDLHIRSYAAFGEATYKVSDNFRVTGGLRYTYERKLIDGDLVNNSFPNQAPPPVCSIGTFDPSSTLAPLFCRLSVPMVNRLTFESVTFKAGVEFDLGPRSMAFANVSTGFKSGGYYQAPPPNTFRPEKLTAYVAGIKNRFLDNRLQVNVELFYWDYKDHQESFIGPTSIPGFYAFNTANAGRAKSYGADLDILFRPTAADEFSLKVQYNKSRYDSFSYDNPTAIFGPPVTGCAIGPLQGGVQEVNCSGLPLMRAPLWAGTVGYNHTFDLGDAGDVTASFDAQFESGSYRSPAFLDTGRQPAYAIGNFDLAYTTADKRFVVSAFVHNVWNEAVYDFLFRSPFVSSANPLANPEGVFTGAIRPPRTYGARVRVNF